MIALALAAACSPPSTAQSAPPEPGANHGLREIPLTIRTNGKTHRFVVEVAASPREQQVGMMFRTSIARGRGMIFPYYPPQPVGFWMKNTLIPLDMIFIREDGTIARIATATPLSLENVYSYAPVVAVLEIGGGEAARLGIRENDRVEYRL